MRRLSRATGSESGRFGSTVLVDVGDNTLNLHEKMMQELRLATENKERCLFATTEPACPSCAAFGFAISSGALGRATGKLRVVRIDLGEFEEEARAINLPIDRIPSLIQLDIFGQIEDVLDPGEWDTNAPAEFVPIVAKFLDGKLKRRRGAWQRATESQAIDL